MGGWGVRSHNEPILMLFIRFDRLFRDIKLPMKTDDVINHDCEVTHVILDQGPKTGSRPNRSRCRSDFVRAS